MRLPSLRQVRELRGIYPRGTRVELLKMDDEEAPPFGTRGTVLCVDDTGSIKVVWDNGILLNVVYGVDEVRRISEENPKKNKEEA